MQRVSDAACTGGASRLEPPAEFFASLCCLNYVSLGITPETMSVFENEVLRACKLLQQLAHVQDDEFNVVSKFGCIE